MNSQPRLEDYHTKATDAMNSIALAILNVMLMSCLFVCLFEWSSHQGNWQTHTKGYINTKLATANLSHTNIGFDCELHKSRNCNSVTR